MNEIAEAELRALAKDWEARAIALGWQDPAAQVLIDCGRDMLWALRHAVADRCSVACRRMPYDPTHTGG